MHSPKEVLLQQKIACLSKETLLIHFISAFKTESYRYAALLRNEIKRRPFSREEIGMIRQSSFYQKLNGLFDLHAA
jgi:hypothetical protein